VKNGATVRIVLPRKHHGVVTQVIERWRSDGIIDDLTTDRLAESIAIASFDWQKTARYAFILAIVCMAIAVGAILADRVLMELLMRLFNAPAIAKCAFFAAVSAIVFRAGLVLRRKHPHRVYRNEAVFFLGVLALAPAVFFFGVAVDTGTGHYSLLFLIASVLYALLGLWFPSPLVWVFGLLSLGAWMGTETGYMSGGGVYFLGMNYPMRFVIFGGALTALGLTQLPVSTPTGDAMSFKTRILSMSSQTKVVGLLNLFVALWIMSIFGNYGDMTQWYRVHQYELFYWSLLFGAVSIAAIVYGLKRDDGVSRGFGLTFLFINLYTRFFEYFWNSLHKAAFFAILAVTFWYIGSRAEVIWRLGERELQPRSGVKPTPEGGRG